jgi:hypothetical protein
MDAKVGAFDARRWHSALPLVVASNGPKQLRIVKRARL